MSKRRKHPPIITRDNRLPAAAYSPKGYRYALVRIALPENDVNGNVTLTGIDRVKRYYNPDATDGRTWVTTGYKIWRIEEWRDTYGEDYQDDVRHWDFFGEEINIWEGYSDE